MQSGQRRTPRYSFVAAAELVETESGTRINTKLSELSLYGCYCDIMNPLPVGTPIKLKITHQDATCEALGKVIYSQPNIGMGVVFTEVEPGSQTLLDKWLRELGGN